MHITCTSHHTHINMHTIVGPRPTPNTPSVEEFSLTRIDSVSVFSVLGYLDHLPKLWVEFSPKSSNEFCSNFQTSWGKSILTSRTILNEIPNIDWGENPPKPKTSRSNTSWTGRRLMSIYVWRTLLTDFYGPHEFTFFPAIIGFLGNFQKLWSQNVPKPAKHFQGARWSKSTQNSG